MQRLALSAFIFAMALPAVHAASLQNYELTQTLEKVARDSNVGTPRAINEDILDRGYSVEGNELINHLSVRPGHAAQMRDNPDSVRAQLANSVCRNPGYRNLLASGAVLRYQFSDIQSNQPVATERFSKDDCRL